MTYLEVSVSMRSSRVVFEDGDPGGIRRDLDLRRVRWHGSSPPVPGRLEFPSPPVFPDSMSLQPSSGSQRSGSEP